MENIFKAGKYNLEFKNKTLVMGILNITPDSFSDGGLWNTPEKAIKRAFEIEALGADIIDIGGQSTRPGYTQISAEEEWERISPLLKILNRNINIPISIDTFYPEVAEKALSYGADIINDITGFESKHMFEVAAKSDCGIIIMNSKTSKNMKDFFKNKIQTALKYGISQSRICLDPGIGFLESRKEDRFVINNLDKFKIDNIPMLIGISRKRVISEHCENDNYSKLSGTIAANTIAVQKGANIIRVHDVKESVFAAKTVDAILKEAKEIV